MAFLRKISCFLVLFIPMAVLAQSANDERYSVHMILWRGETKVEAGFRAYIARHEVNIDITVHNINRDKSLLPEIIEQVRQAQPDLVYTWGTTIALAVAGGDGLADPNVNITDIPVLHTLVSDPIGVSLVPSNGLSGRNITVVSHVPPIAAQVQAMRSYSDVAKIGVIFNPEEPNSVVNVEALTRAAAEQGIEVILAPVGEDALGNPDPTQLPALIAGLVEHEADFLYIGPDNFVGQYSQSITDQAIDVGLPSFTATELEVREASPLFGLVSRYEAVGELTALQAERILVDGIDPGTIVAQTLSKFTFLIRQDVMLRLKLFPPMQIMRYADIVR
jgi:putative ABC transport system substrate-binding protein